MKMFSCKEKLSLYTGSQQHRCSWAPLCSPSPPAPGRFWVPALTSSCLFEIPADHTGTTAILQQERTISPAVHSHLLQSSQSADHTEDPSHTSCCAQLLHAISHAWAPDLPASADGSNAAVTPIFPEQTYVMWGMYHKYLNSTNWGEQNQGLHWKMGAIPVLLTYSYEIWAEGSSSTTLG